MCFFFFCNYWRTSLVERSGILYIYYANKFKHWKRRWLHLQDQQLAIYQGKNCILFKYLFYILLLKQNASDSSTVFFIFFCLYSKDSHYKRLENTINIRNYRVSITSPTDSISHKGYTFKVIKNFLDVTSWKLLIKNKL